MLSFSCLPVMFPNGHTNYCSTLPVIKPPKMAIANVVPTVAAWYAACVPADLISSPPVELKRPGNTVCKLCEKEHNTYSSLTIMTMLLVIFWLSS